ncbi:type II secretion system protein J [Elusimicrobiota bacterium]
MFINKYKKNKGMTLIEVMITLAIMAVISSSMWLIFMQGFRSWSLNSAQAEVQRDARRLLDLMGRNLRQAEADTITISQDSVDDPPFSKITFIGLRQGTTAQMSYYQSGREFIMEVDGTDTKFGENIRNLNFMTVESGDDEMLSMGVCVEKATYEGRSRIAKLTVRKVRVMN